MARPLRIEFPGAYHVMNRGNTGMNIYRSERNREKFLEGFEQQGDPPTENFETPPKAR